MRPLYFLSISIITILFSCSRPTTSWSDQIIESENNIILVTSLDLSDLLNKADIEKNNRLSVDQKMMYKAFMSSFNNESLGFDIENRQRLFILPEPKKLNAGIFLAGDITDLSVFQKFLTDYFNVTSFNGTEPTLCYIEEFQIHIGFNEKNFVAAFSPDKSFALTKIKSFYNSENITTNNTTLTNYLLSDDDLSFYLSTENLIDFISDINNPLLQIPNFNFLEEYGSSQSMALNFNNGNCTFSLKTNSKNLTNQFYANNCVEEKYKTFLTDNNQLIMFGFLNVVTENISKQLFQLEKLGLLVEINEFLNSIGTEHNELMNIIDGQFSFSFIDFPLESVEDVENSNYDDENDQYWSDEEFSDDLHNDVDEINTILPSFITSIGIENDNLFFDLLNKNNISIFKDSVMDLDVGLFLLYENNVFHLSSNENLINKIAFKGGLNKYKYFDKESVNQPLYISIEFNLSDWPKDVVKDVFNNTDSQLLFKDIKKVIINANNKEGLLKIEMKNEDQNSLKTIMDLILQKRLIEDFI